MIDLNNFQSINFSQFFDSVEFRSGSGYHLVINYFKSMCYMLMIFFQDQDFTIKVNKKVMLCVLKIPTKFGVVPQSFFQN